MKTVYLVRHGESKSNVSDIWIDDTFGLTNKGRGQARKASSYLSKFPIDVIISSNLKRSKETSEIINKKFKKPIIYSDLFIEKKWPSEQSGLSKKSKKSTMMSKTIWEKFPDPCFRYSDEENFNDLKKRIKEALSFIEKTRGENIIVVTHGIILRMILSYIIMGKEITAIECQKFINKAHIKNTGITIMHQRKTKGKPEWQV